MHTLENAREYVKDQMKQGKMTAAEANVRVVQMVGFLVVTKMPIDVRKALNAAVKIGELGRIKKDGLKPEIYHHKNGRANAIVEQRRIENESLEKIKNVFA
jgi:hypothetical protein